MSCSYDIRCKPCGARLGYDVNHGRDHCGELVVARDAIAALGAPGLRDGLYGLDLRLVDDCGRPIQIEFFRVHQGHQLEIVDEYGRVDGECEKSPECPCCKHRFQCRMPKGHAGECDPAFRPESK